jgi:F0F1-type ATP synthase epsilon subunit
VGIRPGHAPYLFLLGEGRLEIGHDSQAGHTYALKGGIAQVERDVIEVLAESVVDTEDLTETDLLKQLQDMDAADYDDDFALAEAKSKAHWIVTQLKTAGKQVPELTKLK